MSPYFANEVSKKIRGRIYVVIITAIKEIHLKTFII